MTPAIQQCSLAHFVRIVGVRDGLYGVVCHPIPCGVTEEEFRTATVAFATFCIEHLAASEFHTYDIIKNNCECFVWFVFTGGAFKYSPEVFAMIKLVHEELRQNTTNFGPANATVLGMSCFILSKQEGLV